MVLADIPETFMRSFYTAAKLRWLMENDPWPVEGVFQGAFQDMVTKFQAAFGHGRHRSRFRDVLLESFDTAFAEDDPQTAPLHPGSQEKSLLRDLYDQLLSFIDPVQTRFTSLHDTLTSDLPFLPDRAEFVSRITYLGVTYATRRRRGLRTSFSLFRKPGPQCSEVVAGQIDSIFYHTRQEGDTVITEPFFLVDKYAPLSDRDQRSNPFSKFSDCNVELRYRRFEEKLLLRLQDLVAHFAALEYTPEGISEPCIVVRSLDRVSHFYL